MFSYCVRIKLCLVLAAILSNNLGLRTGKVLFRMFLKKHELVHGNKQLQGIRHHIHLSGCRSDNLEIVINSAYSTAVRMG